MDASVLFAGLRFDQKLSGAALRRFQKRRANEPPESPSVTYSESGLRSAHPDGFSRDGAAILLAGPENANTVEPSAKKRKRRSADNSGPSLGTDLDVPFNVFGPLSVAAPTEPPQDSPPVKSKAKSQARLAEEVAILRKKFRLHVAGQAVPPPLVGFEQLKSQCKKFLLQCLFEAGWKEPTPIQRQAIPILLERRECLACAPTGSGKTLAFMLPIIINLKVSNPTGVRAVILCPIRELATQIGREFKALVPSKRLRVRVLTTALFKTADFGKLPCDVLITTPLRLDHLLKDKKIDLSRVEYLVMDESDKLFEMGFLEQIDSIVAACSNPKVVRALFSATLPDTVEELSRTIMHDTIRIIVGDKNIAATTIHQRLLFVGSEDGKLLAIRQLFNASLKPPILLFVDSKERAKNLHRELAFEDVKVDSIHADRTQEERNVAVEKFREGTTWVLIATDVMARGMDFKGVNCVINYDFPQTIATYIHRIGRCGRAGRPGESVTLYTEKDKPYLRSVAHVIRGAGGEVPDWMLSLRKVNAKKRK